MALAGNKDDKYEHQEVSENEAKMFAKEINAIFQKTSAKQSRGVDELFKLIAQKYIDPNTENLTNLTNDELKKRGQKLKVNGSDTNEQSKKNSCIYALLFELFDLVHLPVGLTNCVLEVEVAHQLVAERPAAC